MAGQTTTLVQANMSTDALFRTWGLVINAGMAAAGCVQTADTGQINWTTVVRPGSGGLVAGYEIWRFNDSLQSSAPVFIKLEYGTGNSIIGPQIWITVGTGSNGAGTITGTDIAGVTGATSVRNFCVTTTNNPPTATGSIYVYGDGATVACVMWPSLGVNFGGGGFIVERFRNWDGTASADGVWVGLLPCSGSFLNQQLSYLPGVVQNSGAQASAIITVYPQFSTYPTTMNIGGTVYPQPIFHGCSPRALGPSQYLTWVVVGDYPQGSVSLTHYGTARSFLSLGVGATNLTVGWSNGIAGRVSFLMRVD